jgi:HEAT repeat protein
MEEADSVIDGMVEALSTRIFPPEDLSLLGEMRNSVLDSTRPKEERLALLENTLEFFFPRRFMVFDDVIQREVSRSIALTVAEIVSNSPDRDVRVSAWFVVRSLGDPYLVAPLAESLRRDSAVEVRLLTIELLAANFPSDPVAQTALNSAALSDGDYLVRNVARWAIANESDRRTHLNDMLAEVAVPQASNWLGVIFSGSTFANAVDYVTRGSAEILLDIVAASPNTQRGITNILGKAPPGEVVPLMLERLRDDPDVAVRRVAAVTLMGRQNDPGVVAALRYARDYDPSPEVRAAASAVR